MASKQSTTGREHVAVARGISLPISTKHSVELSRSLRYKTTAYAKGFLEQVAGLKKAVPFYRFTQDTGHKAGMAAGRYPQKAAHQFLKLVKAVEANAQAKGLNTSELKIIKLVANKASIPQTGARHRHGTKRTHIEIEVMEKRSKKGKQETKPDVKATSKTGMNVAVKQEEAALDSSAHVSKAQVKPVEAKAKVAEPSAQDLLQQAEKKAAELQQKRKADKSVQEVSGLYDQLQKKGTLRGKGGSA